MSLNEKTVLVTGASRGIGKAIAETLGKQGATVIGTATTPEGAEKISQYLQQTKISGAGFALNVCDDEGVKETIALINEQFSAPVIVVNNAGITRDNLFLRMKPEQWDAVIDTNLNSVFRVTKACIKSMVKGRWGWIINITSVVGVSGNPGQANYCAAKAGMIGFTKSLAQEYAAYGVTVNAVAPGFVDTDMTREIPEKQREQILAMIPMRVMGRAEDIANTVAFLVSDEASYITGQTLQVNGGMCMT